MLTGEAKAQIRQAVVEYVRSGKPIFQSAENTELVPELHKLCMDEYLEQTGLDDEDDYVVIPTIEELARRGANADQEIESAVEAEYNRCYNKFNPGM